MAEPTWETNAPRSTSAPRWSEPVQDRAMRALRELDAEARDCFGAGRQQEALAAVNKAAGVRLVLSFMEGGE